jgi:mycoredoxin
MEKIVLYGTRFCPQVYTTRRELDRNQIEYAYIDIREDQAAAERVRKINNGYESVPTLVFPDGSTLTEPSTAELLDRLETMGKQVEASVFSSTLSHLIESPSLRLIGALFVLAGIFSDLQSLTWIGLVLLVISFVLFFLHKRA